MWNFLKNSKVEEKTRVDHDALDQILAKVKILDLDISSLKSKVDSVETNIASLRNAFNRRGLKEDPKKEESTDQKDINNPVILPWNGSVFKHSQ